MIPNEATSDDELWWVSPAVKDQLAKDPTALLRSHGINLPPGTAKPIIMEVLRITHLLWVEGRIIPKDRFYLDPADEGLLFGRGVWESTRTIQGEPWLWDLHAKRLLRTAAECDIPLSPERVPSAQQVSAYVKSITTQDVVLRLNVTAGHHDQPGLVWMSVGLRPLPQKSVRLKTIQSLIPKGLPYLYGKTFQYASRLKLGQEAAKFGFDTTLLFDADNNLLEAAHANVFVRLATGWATPLADGGLLAGTVREHLVKKAPLKITEQAIPVSALADAKEVFVTNSNVGIVPVTQVDQHSYGIGPETEQLAKWLFPS